MQPCFSSIDCVFVAGGFRLCGGDKGAMKTDEVCGRPLDPFAFAFEAGNLAVRLLRDGISNQVIGVRQGKVFNMPIVDALKVEKHFRRDLYDLVNNL